MKRFNFQITFTLLFLCSIHLNAQISFQELTGASFEGVHQSSIAFEDIDGDNDQDVLITGQNATGQRLAKLYSNNGLGSFTLVTGTPFEGVYLGSIAFADIDGDNDKDVLITGNGSASGRSAKLYVNDGTGGFSLVLGTPFDGVWASDIAFTDIDGDNDQDVLITGNNVSNQRIAKLYVNDGMGVFTLVVGTPFDGILDGSIDFADIDGDNDQDVLITGLNSSGQFISKLYTNDGTGTFALVAGTPFEGVFLSSIAFSDIDGDNDQDVLISGLNPISNQRISKLYTNDGTGSFALVAGTPFDGVLNCSIAFSDIDGDNDQDVLISGFNSSGQGIAKLYTNNGSGSFALVPGTPFDGVQSSSIAFADVDGDNDQDLLITGNNASNLKIAKLYLNDSPQLSSITYTFNNGVWSPNDPSGVATADDEIVITSGDAVINTNTTCNSVTVNPGAGLTVNTGVTLTATVGMVLESSATSYSSLILDGTVAGTMSYERHVNINGSGSTGSNDLVSAPLTGQDFASFAIANPNILNNGALYLFGPFEKVTGTYVNWAATETATLDSGVGYRTGTTDNGTVTFTGTAENGAITNDIQNAGSNNEEWNLIGNPYPSYMNVQQFFNHDVGGVTNIQLFDAPTAAIYGYDGSALNGWTIYNLANTTASTLIAPGQGFFVSADFTNTSSYDLEFTPAMRSTGSDDDFIQGRNAELTFLKLVMSSNNNNARTDFYFNDNASQGLDVGYDAEAFEDTKLYSHLIQDNEGKAIAIQTLNSSDLSDVSIPLGVNAAQGEQISFSISETTLPASVLVYLDDVVANTSTLLNTSDYSITPTTALSGTGRFFLRTSEDALFTIDNDFDSLNIFSINNSKEIVVSGLLKEQTTLVLYDIQGRQVISTNLDSATLDNRIDVSSLSGGVYVVTIDNNKQQRTQKVVIK